MIEHLNIRNFVSGMILSITSWEVWENILLSLMVALVGGFMAAAGRQIHKQIFEWHKTRKNKNNGKIQD